MVEHIATTQRQFERRIRDRLFNLDGRGAPGVPVQPSRNTAASPPSPETSAS
jgi:hypothetical protein